MNSKQTICEAIILLLSMFRSSITLTSDLTTRISPDNEYLILIWDLNKKKYTWVVSLQYKFRAYYACVFHLLLILLHTCGLNLHDKIHTLIVLTCKPHRLSTLFENLHSLHLLATNKLFEKAKISLKHNHLYLIFPFT